MVNAMGQNEEDFDDLKKIKGIAETREKVLRDELNVYFYQDLASMDINVIEKLFKERGESVSSELIKNWIIEAKKLGSNSKLKNSEEKNSFLNKILKKQNQSNDTNWQSTATFIVEFQEHINQSGGSRNRTTIHHMQKDTGASWPGYEFEGQCKWMKECVVDDAETKTKEIMKIKDRIFVWIENVYFKQSNITTDDYLEKGMVPSLNSEKSFDIEIQFTIKGEGLTKLIKKEEVTYQASCMVQDVSSDNSKKIGSTKHELLNSDKIIYKTSIKDITLSKGQYRFWSVVKLDLDKAVPHFFEISILNVE